MQLSIATVAILANTVFAGYAVNPPVGGEGGKGDVVYKTEKITITSCAG